MIKKITIVVPFILLITVVVYFNSAHYINKRGWKYKNGANIGEWINSESFQIKGGYFYRNNMKVGQISFCTGKWLIIEDPTSQETGYYIAK